MSRRKRHSEKGTETHQIEWLRHRTGYPSPEERERIIRLRKQLTVEVISLGIERAGWEDPRYRKLINKYGKDEVLRAEEAFREGLDMPSRVADDARDNRNYRMRYSRFGAGLPYYKARERAELFAVYIRGLKDTFEGPNTSLTAEVEEVKKRLLMDWLDWRDLVPPAIPPRPHDYSAPEPASYLAPTNELLTWGNDLDKYHDFADEQEYFHWKRYIPTLTRMALDPGLLNGWPSESRSWAPWHAIHMLGNLQAWESVPALAELADLEEDWLSDHLPHVWAEMGIEVEPVLWMIVEDHSASAKRRGLAAESLYMMTEENNAIAHKVVRGFEKLLRNAKAFDPALNGYLIDFLQDMEADDDVYKAIREAFEQDRVDLDYITPEDLEDEGLDNNEDLNF